jgi:DeoR family ulaG and ulaABCDEF operon transcriptional repressor
MLEPERHELVLRVLRQGRFASVLDIAELVNCSEATVRRDLTKLETAGKLHRVRGGAELTQASEDGFDASAQLPFEYRKGILLEKKRSIARRAASLCTDGETVIIDGGSTTFQMVEFLREAHLKIITNSFAIAEVLIKQSQNTVILNGGIVYPDSQLILDPFQEEGFRNYSATKVFMGVYGIDNLGSTNTDMLLIATERAMIDRGKELIILADSSKFDRRGNLFLCRFDKISTIITDSGITERQREMVQANKVELIVV